MQYHAHSLGLSGGVNAILRDLIHETLGLMYEPHQFDQVTDRLAPLIVARGLGSFMDYYYVLKYGNERDEWLRVMDALAVQETYFWREIDQLRAVVTEVVPGLIDALKGRPLRIWSIPCATGEEPLTLAILLAEHGWFDRAPIEILASDGSQMAIARARSGEYTARSFRNLPVPLRDKYFTAGDGFWRVRPDVHQRVSYDVINLMAEDQLASHASVPVIFCRNVFIYFSDRSIRRVLSVFERCMSAPGFLCVAAAESLLRRTSVFELEDIGGAFVYVKRSAVNDVSPAVFDVGRAS